MPFTSFWPWRKKEKQDEGEYMYETLPESNLTSDEVLELTGFGKFQFKLLIIVGLRVFAHGSSFALMTVISTSLQCQWSLSNF